MNLLVQWNLTYSLHIRNHSDQNPVLVGWLVGNIKSSQQLRLVIGFQEGFTRPMSFRNDAFSGRLIGWSSSMTYSTTASVIFACSSLEIALREKWLDDLIASFFSAISREWQEVTRAFRFDFSERGGQRYSHYFPNFPCAAVAAFWGSQNCALPLGKKRRPNSVPANLVHFYLTRNRAGKQNTVGRPSCKYFTHLLLVINKV